MHGVLVSERFSYCQQQEYLDTHLIHRAEKVVAAAIRAYRLSWPDVPVEPVEDHHRRRPEP